MYLWDIKRLKRDLSVGTLAEAESFKYLFVYILGLSISALPRSQPASPGFVILSLLGPVIVACGVYYCYLKNGGHKGEFFAHRFFPLIFVSGMRWAVMLFLPYIGIFVIFVALKDIPLNPIPLVIGIFIINVLFYWRIGRHLDDVSKEYEQNTKSPVTLETSAGLDITF